MNCNRKGCKNILCDRYSARYGYICDDCFDELMSMGVNTNVDEFMHSEKPDLGKRNESVYDHFAYIFPDQSN